MSINFLIINSASTRFLITYKFYSKKIFDCQKTNIILKLIYLKFFQKTYPHAAY